MEIRVVLLEKSHCCILRVSGIVVLLISPWIGRLLRNLSRVTLKTLLFRGPSFLQEEVDASTEVFLSTKKLSVVIFICPLNQILGTYEG